MSPVDTYEMLDGTWYPIFGGGRPVTSIPDDNFVLGMTIPDINAGNIAPRSWINRKTFDGDVNGAGEFVPVNNETIKGVDFGNTPINLSGRAAFFEDCTWEIGGAGYSARRPVVNAYTSTGSSFDFCSFKTLQHAKGYNASSAITGQNYRVNRTFIEGFVDCLGGFPPTSAGGNLGVEVLGSYLGRMSWWWWPTGGTVHPSDTMTHNDPFQWQGGKGLHIEGCWSEGLYSESVGHGVGGQTSMTVDGTMYNLATKRYEIVQGNGAYPNKNGGSIAGFVLCSNAGRGDMGDAKLINNWGQGGAQWINGGGFVGAGPFGEIRGNRIRRNQRQSNGQISIKSGVAATVEGNVDMDTGALIGRVNG